MNEGERGKTNEQDGQFVETAFSGEEVDAAVLAEIELGVDGDPCGFVGGAGKPAIGK